MGQGLELCPEQQRLVPKDRVGTHLADQPGAIEGLVHTRLDPGQNQMLPPRPGVAGHLGDGLGTGCVEVVGMGQA